MWNIIIPPIVGLNPPQNSDIVVTVDGGGSGGVTTLNLPVTKESELSVKCGLCKSGKCFPVQVISFGK